MMPADLRVEYPDTDGRKAVAIATDPEHAKRLAERLQGRVMRWPTSPGCEAVKQYVLERQFGIRRRNGGFV